MSIKKAILTGGGHATRLRPITTTINKHLIPLANKPMIFHAIEKVIEAGVNEIFINTNPDETELQKVVGDGSRWGIKISFFVQEGGPQGIAHVVKCAEHFIGHDPFLFYLSDNIVLGSLKLFIEEFNNSNQVCKLAFSKVPDPERFGIPVFAADGTLLDIVEKPEHPTNNFAVTGIYLYGADVFFKAFDHIKKSDRGEYEISSIHSYFLKQGWPVGWKEITGWWKDTGKPDDLILANQLLLEERPAAAFLNEGKHEDSVQLTGKAQIGTGTVLKGKTIINGPVIIGNNCLIEDAVIGPYVTIGNGSVIKNTSLKNSIIFRNCELTIPVTIDESIIGEKAKMVTRGPGAMHRVILGDQTLVEW